MFNQTDLEEKNTQIALMGEIYSGARQVAVFLGESQDDGVMYWPDYGDNIMRQLKDEYETGSACS
jgi:hypothetical protein